MRSRGVINELRSRLEVRAGPQAAVNAGILCGRKVLG